MLERVAIRQGTPEIMVQPIEIALLKYVDAGLENVSRSFNRVKYVGASVLEEYEMHLGAVRRHGSGYSKTL